MTTLQDTTITRLAHLATEYDKLSMQIKGLQDAKDSLIADVMAVLLDAGVQEKEPIQVITDSGKVKSISITHRTTRELSVERLLALAVPAVIIENSWVEKDSKPFLSIR